MSRAADRILAFTGGAVLLVASTLHAAAANAPTCTSPAIACLAETNTNSGAGRDAVALQPAVPSVATRTDIVSLVGSKTNSTHRQQGQGAQENSVIRITKVSYPTGPTAFPNGVNRISDGPNHTGLGLRQESRSRVRIPRIARACARVALYAGLLRRMASARGLGRTAFYRFPAAHPDRSGRQSRTLRERLA
jgi:hypothetical protein